MKTWLRTWRHLRFFLPPPLTPGEFKNKNKKLIQMFRDILIKLPADSPQVHECIKYFTSEALELFMYIPRNFLSGSLNYTLSELSFDAASAWCQQLHTC